MCTECNLAFFLSPLKAGIVLLSFAIAAAALLLMRRVGVGHTRKKVMLLYVHVFAFVFPFLFFLFFRGCQSYFSGCDQSRAIAAMLGLTGIIALLIAAAVAPFLFVRRHWKSSLPVGSKSLIRFVQENAESLGMPSPRISVVNTADPIAFSSSLWKPTIFLSAGLFDILGRREVEAIVLHELSHLSSSASFFRLSSHLAGLFSPFARLAAFGGSIADDERAADAFAIKGQGTERHLDSAKGKIIKYNREKSVLSKHGKALVR